MNKLKLPEQPDQYRCIASGCIVNPDKPKEQCHYRDEYYKKNGMRPMGMLDGIVQDR